MSRRLHYSKKPIGRPRTRTLELTVDHKPSGLWYSVDGGWEEWCRDDAEWDLPPFVYAVEVDEDKILQLTTVSQLDDFHDDYRAGESHEEYRRDWIDWARVGEQWGGIEIAPYQWERRLDGEVHRWYYGWDCASGCVWDVKALTLVKEEQA